MLTYAFSIFVRGYLALSGFLVFFVTASLYGAEGRGIIGFGNSIFAALAIFMSLNLGRVFLASLLNENLNKKDLLFYCLSLNILVSGGTAVLGTLYWWLAPSARAILSGNQIIAFSLTSFFYIWSHNGHVFFSSHHRTRVQDLIIFITRTAILTLLGLLVYFKSSQISIFIWSYSLILTFGTFTEIFVVKQLTDTKIVFKAHFQNYLEVIKRVVWPHLDYVLFNIFPPILMVISASYLSIEDLGRVNFAIQLTNLLFLFSTTAHIRVNAYVASGGVRSRIHNFWKLLGATFLATLVGAALLTILAHFLPQYRTFSSFEGVSELFVIATLTLPGFILFQFFSPIWIETNQLRKTVRMQGANFVLCMLVSPWILTEYGSKGFMALYALFYLNNIPMHLWLYFTSFRSTLGGEESEPRPA